jgi:flagellar FliL protein
MAQSENAALAPPQPGPRKRRRWAILAAALLVLGAGAAGAAIYVLRGLPGGAGWLHPAARAAAATPPAPVDVEVPEITVTLPNGGHPRQLRIRLSLELAGPPDPAHPAVSPQLYDALITYLRTLTDADLDGGMSVERLRSDLFRRIDLVLGPGLLRDVLITELLIA